MLHKNKSNQINALGDSQESTPKEEVNIINKSSLEIIGSGHLQQTAKGTSLEEGDSHWAL